MLSIDEPNIEWLLYRWLVLGREKIKDQNEITIIVIWMKNQKKTQICLARPRSEVPIDFECESIPFFIV